MIEPIDRAALIAELEARLASLPTMMELQAWKPRTLDEAIERTRLSGERLATARLLSALRASLETMEQREKRGTQ